MDIFENGTAARLDEILANREWRVGLQNQLMKEFPQSTVVAVKLNIPGWIKSTPLIKEIFITVWDQLKIESVHSLSFVEAITGPEGFLVFDQDLTAVKKQMIEYEEGRPLGRLFDIDVMGIKTDARQLSRTDLGFSQRRCYVCSKSAKECSRDGRHSIDEIKFAMNRMAENAK